MTANHVKNCGACFATDKKLLTCSQCKSILYCSKLCQKNHWKDHKSYCGNLNKLLFETSKEFINMTIINNKNLFQYICIVAYYWVVNCGYTSLTCDIIESTLECYIRGSYDPYHIHVKEQGLLSMKFIINREDGEPTTNDTVPIALQIKDINPIFEASLIKRFDCDQFFTESDKAILEDGIRNRKEVTTLRPIFIPSI